MSVTVKAADAAQFLSLVPRLLGCTPTQSLVLVPMAAGRSLGAMRLDLPPDDVADAVASSAIGMVCRLAEADAMIAVVYTSDALAEGAAAPTTAGASDDASRAAAEVEACMPGAALIKMLQAKADACGLRLLDALTVASNGWASHLDPEVPPGGHPLSSLEVRRADASALATAGVDASAGDQASGATLPAVGQPARRAVAQALRSLSSALEVICGIPSVGASDPRIDPAALEAACELDDVPALFEEALEWHPGESPMRIAMLGWCLSRPSLRDVALVQWATDTAGGDIAMEAQRLWEDGAEYPADLASIMWGEGARPDAARLERALRLTREVAALLPKKHRPGALAMCAWLSWALGRSSHADRYATMALSIDRRHGLADIIRSFAGAGHLPDWAFRLE